jgi:hypothetical protein
MKKSSTLLLLVFFVFDKCFPQDQSPPLLHFDSIVRKELKLVKGWKFHAGDDPQWAKTAYDDSAWEAINPIPELHHLPLVKEAGIGWFRLKMRVDSSLMNERIAMVLTSMGACEIYLNGELLYKFGTVSPDYALEQTRLISYRPFSLKLGDQPLQELAVRYSFHKKNLYSNLPNTTCFQLILKENNEAFSDYIRYEGILS